GVVDVDMPPVVRICVGSPAQCSDLHEQVAAMRVGDDWVTDLDLRVLGEVGIHWDIGAALEIEADRAIAIAATAVVALDVPAQLPQANAPAAIEPADQERR